MSRRFITGTFMATYILIQRNARKLSQILIEPIRLSHNTYV